jgi:hypothetical protein
MSATAPKLPPYAVLDYDTKMWEVKNNVWDSTGKAVIYQNAKATKVRTSSEQQYLVNPSVFAAGNIVNQQQCQINIAPGLMQGYFEYAQLELQFQETSNVNSVTLAPLPYIFSTIQPAISTAFNNSGAPIHNIAADALYAQLQHVTPAQLTNILAFNQMNMTNTAYASPTAIPAGGTAFYVLPLFMSPIIGMNSQVQNGNIIVSLNWGGSNAVVAGTGTASLTGVALRVYTHANPIVDPGRNIMISQDVFIKNQVDWMNVNTTTVPLAAGVRTQIPLAGLPPVLAGAMLIMIRTNKTTSGTYNFVPLNGTNGSESTSLIEFVNASGLSQLGNGGVSGLVSRSSLQVLESVGTMSSVVPLYWLYFGARPMELIRNGDTSDGCLQLQSNMSLYLTPSAGSNFASANYIVDVYVLRQVKLRQINGMVDLLTT